jgi:YggT family protein
VRSLPGVARRAKPGLVAASYALASQSFFRRGDDGLVIGSRSYAWQASLRLHLRYARRFIPRYNVKRFSREGRRSMFGPVIVSVLYVFNTLIDLYEFVIIIAVVASWLIVFGVLSTRNQFARSLVRALDALTEPVFRQVRRVIPSIGGIDLSPIIVFIVLEVLRRLVNGYAVMAYG